MDDRSPAEVAEYLWPYPFQEQAQNNLFREYVDRILGFCPHPDQEIGFENDCQGGSSGYSI